MSVDLSEFEKLARPRHVQCKIRTALDRLSVTEGKQLEAALAADFNAGAIEKWIKARDLPMTTRAVVAHRKQECTCYGDD